MDEPRKGGKPFNPKIEGFPIQIEREEEEKEDFLAFHLLPIQSQRGNLRPRYLGR